MMKRLLALVPTCLALALPAAQAAPATPEYKIATAGQRGTYIVVGRDLCTYVAPDAGFDCEAVPTAGSAANVYQLRFEPGVKFAIVQSDVFQAFQDKAAAGSREAANLIRPLRVILPLYNEEVYFVARADSPLASVGDIRDARIAAGEFGSGTALTSATLYQAMFRTPMPRPLYMSNEEALVALTVDRTVDVAVVVGGQPMKLLADMKPEAKALVKLLAFDAESPAGREALKTYFAATVRRGSYPNLLEGDLPALAVKAFLVTYDYNLQQTRGAMAAFARSLCRHLPDLREKGHPKWKEVYLDLPELGAGWSYYPATARELRACAAPAPPPRPPRGPSAACSPQEYALGLCGKP